MTAASKFVANDSINMLIVVYLTFNIIGRSSEQQNHENGIKMIWMKTKYY